MAQLGFSQSIDERIAPTRQPLSEVELVLMPNLNNAALLQAELERRGPGIAPRFAETFEVDISPQTHGNWEVSSNGNAVWRLRVLSANAYSLNLGFDQYLMPRGGSLIVYSPNQKRVMGPFTPADNEEHEELWTPIFDGEQLVIEVQLPADKREELQLHLKSINHDFIGFSTMALSGSCNLDVICGEADGWGIVEHYRDIIQSVAVIGLNGGTFCTGFLVNNARQDCTPYFMTANHCGINANTAASLVAYWNYENSTCRQPNSGASGGNGDGSLADFNTGAIFRAGYTPSDFTLVELDDPVSETADAFFAGWTAIDTAPLDTVICVHHPSTHEKRISFEFDQTEIGSYGGGGSNNDHITVPDWDIGTTEGGSSGSPLFNREKQVVGQLHGGLAACGNNEYDSYGWFAISWEGGGTPQSRLKDWLDPDQTGIIELAGRDQLLCNYYVLASNASQTVCAPDIVVYNLEISENFVADVDLSLVGLPTGLNATFADNPVAPGGTTTLTISNTGAVPGGSNNLSLIGTDGSETANSILNLTIYSGVPTATSLVTPTDGEEGLFLSPTLAWAGQNDATSYTVQLATTPDFTNIIAAGNNLNQTSFSGLTLETETVYYWRVHGNNICGEGQWSTTFSFTTGAITCASLGAGDLPQTIETDNAPDVISTIEVNLPGFVSDVQVLDLSIFHSFVGDVTVTLTSPEGTVATLFARPGNPESFYGCNGDNLELSFSDSAPNTADDLENSCGDSPAIGGAFQPVDALASFIGETAAGLWTLTVSDAVDDDGGSVENWDLALCVSIPDEVIIISPTSNFEMCAATEVNFDVLIGTGFEGDVTLSASGLPVGTMVNFNDNPVAPGATVTVTVSGLIDPGSYVLNLMGTDGINNTAINLDFEVTSTPDAAVPTNPANGSADIPNGLTLQWGDVDGVEAYTVVVASDPDFTNIVVTNTQAATFYNLSGLEFGTTYFWRVDVSGECGDTEGVEVFSFTTLPDLTFAINPTGETACSAEVVDASIQVGPGFTGPATITFTAGPGGPPTVAYDVDPTQIMPNSTVGVTFSDLFNLNTGFNSVTFTISDGTYEATTTFSIIVENTPTLPNLTFPADGSIFPNNPDITFLWDAVDGATSYLFEIATDLNFANIVESVNTTGTFYSAENIEEEGTYFWRVTALNNCGGATAAPLNFVYDITNQTSELNGKTINIMPNPTRGQLQILLSNGAGNDLKVDLFSIDGRQLQQHEFENGQLNMQLNLTNYPAGVYLLRMTEGKASVSQRIVLQ
ncbi:MAG: hypothetical protein DHS20C18_11670 [Saprospiraceae bacterium]|nr:MAG: hypothetical protein DHS20C18_11670 [Saprospiraceae bacterium]